MIALATNLIKLCAFAVQMEGPYVSDLVKNRHIDIGTVLEHALQLFPYAEIEVLDEVHQLLIDDAANSDKGGK